MKPTDLFGSDVYVNYTAVYTWNSNQMAHAMMGFAGTSLLIGGFAELGAGPWWGLLFAIIPALKDITDYGVDLKRAGHIFRTTDDHVRELRQDGLTDNWFWNAGTLFAVFLAVAMRDGGWGTIILLVIAVVWALIGILLIAPKFVGQKRLFDVSALPYFFRLPNFAGNPLAVIRVGETDEQREEDRAAAVKAVEDFTYERGDAPNHLMLFGPPRCRKTTLASAIGSGLTVRDRKVRYIPLSTLVDELGTPPPSDRADTEPVPPQTADMVIVDDVDADIPEGLAARLADRRSVWVAADPDEAAGVRRRLRDDLKQDVVAIELGQPRPQDRVDGQPVPDWLTRLSLGTLGLSAVAIVGSLILLVLW